MNTIKAIWLQLQLQSITISLLMKFHYNYTNFHYEFIDLRVYVTIQLFILSWGHYYLKENKISFIKLEGKTNVHDQNVKYSFKIIINKYIELNFKITKS